MKRLQYQDNMTWNFHLKQINVNFERTNSSLFHSFWLS